MFKFHDNQEAGFRMNAKGHFNVGMQQNRTPDWIHLSLPLPTCWQISAARVRWEPQPPMISDAQQIPLPSFLSKPSLIPLPRAHAELSRVPNGPGSRGTQLEPSWPAKRGSQSMQITGKPPHTHKKRYRKRMWNFRLCLRTLATESRDPLKYQATCRMRAAACTGGKKKKGHLRK